MLRTEQQLLIRGLLLSAVALLVAASKVSFAIGPVPLTMQTFAVAVVGAWLGTRQGVAAVIAYLALGFAGLPVFATPLCGPAALMGPPVT